MMRALCAAIGTVLSIVVAGCGAGTAITEGGPMTSLASLAEHKGAVPSSPVVLARLGVPAEKVPASVRPSPFATSGGPKNFARISAAGTLGWVREPRVEAYLNSIVAALQRGLPKPLPVRVFVTGQAAYSAFATPDNEIIVTIGLLRSSTSEGEIAATLAHELSHLLLAHYTRELETRKILDATTIASQAGVMVAVASEMRRDKTQSGHHYSLQDERAARAKMFRAMQASAWAVTFFDDVASSHLSREQEFEADMLGIDLLARAGFKTIQMKRVLEVLEIQWKEQEKAKKTIADRFGDRATAAAKVSVLGVLMGGGADDIMKSVTDEFISFGLSEIGHAYTGIHPSPHARIELASAYIEKHHGLDLGTDAVLGAYDRTIQSKHFQAIVAGYDRFFKAMQLRDEGKLDLALKEANSGLVGSLAQDPGGRHLAFTLLLELGDLEAAYRTLTSAKVTGSAPISYYTALASEYAKRGKLKEALAVLDSGERDFGDAAMFMPARIRLLKAAANQELTASALEKCLTSKHHEVRTACHRAAAGGGDAIARGRDSKGLLTEASKDGKSGQQGMTTLLKNITGIKLPGTW